MSKRVIVSGRFKQKKAGQPETLSPRRYEYIVRGDDLTQGVIDYLRRFGNEIFVSIGTPVSNDSVLTSIKILNSSSYEGTLRVLGTDPFIAGIKEHQNKNNRGEINMSEYGNIGKFEIKSGCVGPEPITPVYNFDEYGNRVVSIFGEYVQFREGIASKIEGEVFSLPIKENLREVKTYSPDLIHTGDVVLIGDREVVVTGTLPFLTGIATNGSEATYPYPINVKKIEPVIPIDVVLTKINGVSFVDKEMVNYANENIDGLMSEIKEKEQNTIGNKFRKAFGLKEKKID